MPRPRKPKTSRDRWGSVTQKENGRWRVRYLGPDQRRRSGGVFRTKAEAEEARARLHTAIVGGTWRPPSPGDTPTLAVYARSWLEQAERHETLSPRTVALYRHQLERLVIPDLGPIALGDVPVGKLGREIVKKWEIAARDAARANAVAHSERRNGAFETRPRRHPARAWARSLGIDVPSTGRLPASVLAAWFASGSPESAPPSESPRSTGERQFEQARTVLSAVCTAAVEDDFLAEHPVRLRPGTKGRAKRPAGGQTAARPVAPVVSLETVFALAAAMPDPYGVAVLLTTFAGLRGGETFALARRHVRYDGQGCATHVRIERALVELPRQAIDFGPPKTGAGTRDVAIPQQIGQILTAHVAQNVPDDADALLFTSSTGRPVARSRRSAVMVAARKKVGAAHVTWHGLRHTGLTLAASVPGTTVRNLMDRGGHTTPRAALIYQHTAADADSLLAAGLGELIAMHSADKPAG